MFLKIIRLLLVLLLVLSQVSYAQNSEVKVLIASGWEAVSQDNLDGALAKFEKALEADPANTEAMLGKARCLLYLNRLKEAESIYKKILAQETENQSAILGLARAYNWQGKYDLAVTEYEIFLKLSPDNLEAKNELAKIHQWQGELASAQLLEDPRNTHTLKGIGEIKGIVGTTQKFFVNYLTERDAGDFKSHTTVYGYRVRKPVASGNEMFAEYRLEDYQESGRGHSIGNVVVLGGSHRPLEKLGVNGQLDLRTYTKDIDFFAGGMVNAIWNYYNKNSLKVQYDHDLFDVLDDVRANRYSAELNNYITQKLLMTNYYQFADISDDNNSQLWSNSLTYQILKQKPDLSVSVGYRHRDFKDISSNYYSPQDLGSIFYSLYIGKALAKTYSYAMVKFFDNSDKIDSHSYLIGSEYSLKENITLGAEVSYFNTTDKYHALGASIALHWKF